ncbi:hypothetical protein DSBG_1378 [Desulfosporosinus sp. BG]|nr:hypothetical protein DSBG_1378 [Desulfosporosinus sp. BG]
MFRGTATVSPIERYLDSELFDLLKKVVVFEDKSVSMIEQAEIFSSACFYHKLISRENRDAWLHNALEALRDAELVFCDPDNGPIGAKSKGSKNSEKYICPSEIVDYYNRGQNVVYYCQKARRTWEQWDKTKNEMIEYLPDARLYILTYHKGTQRSYIFVMHPEDGRRYIAILQKFLYTAWSRVFTEESPEKNSPSSRSVGGKLELEMDSGVIATITAQEDGWVTIKFSDQPGRSTRTRIDHFLSNYRR